MMWVSLLNGHAVQLRSLKPDTLPEAETAAAGYKRSRFVIGIVGDCLSAADDTVPAEPLLPDLEPPEVRCGSDGPFSDTVCCCCCCASVVKFKSSGERPTCLEVTCTPLR